MVGQGKRIGLVSRAGRLKPLATDAPLNRCVLEKVENAMSVDYRYRAGDFVPFLKAGKRAISLEATDSGAVPPTYHLGTDKPSQIQPEILSEIIALVRDLIQRN